MNDTQAYCELPKYKCHKEVHALKIKSVNVDDSENWSITPEDSRYLPFEVSRAYMQKHSPKAGGYYVVYDDGYKSYSPANAFEAGYTLVK